MTEAKRASEDNAKEEPAEAPKEPAKEAKSSVNKGVLLVLLIIILSLGWSLLADRFTPFTSQARVQGYVVGVAPKVAGLVTKVWVDNNQVVEKDQPLFQIDTDSYEIALKKASSDLEQAQRQVGAGSAGVETAQANLRAALAAEEKSEKEARRLKRLYREDPGTVSVRRLEVADANLKQARAKVDSARSEIQRAIEQKGGDEEDNAILKTAESAVEKSELDLGNTLVKAPSAGVITDLRTDVGLYAGTGNPVITLIAIHEVWINAEFTENNLGHMRTGNPVEIVFDSLPGRVFTGTVGSIGIGISAGQSTPPGTLPSIQNNRDWLRQAQRFPVVVNFDALQHEDLVKQLRVGGQTSVIAYTPGEELLNQIGHWYIRLLSWLSYAY